MMAFPVRLMLLSSICSLVFFSALFFCGFISLGLYLVFFFSTVSIYSCLLAFTLRPTTLHTSPSLTTNTDIIPSSASSSSPPSGKLTYDVFLSFRGKDTRYNFTDHLYAALNQRGIFTFRDDEELKKGESIAPNLLKAIEESRYVVVVFSQCYADSAWCLDEIAKVADCMKEMGQKVLPVFYHVDPSEVRRQTGDHFGKAFQKHRRRYIGDPDKVNRWKEALFQVGNLSGWHLQDGYETKVIQEIVEKIFTELNPTISISEGLVGMHSHLNEMLSYLDIGCPDVRIIGICGMGGIGKTTIAQVVFERVQTLFEGCSFLENVREVFEKQGALHLQEQLLSNLLKCNVSVQNTKMGKNVMKQRLCTKRVLLILDNVDQDEQLDALCDRESFGPGSRIIITTRDEHLLREADEVYTVNPLTADEALDLFCMKAFKKHQLVGEDFLKLSKEFLEYANGHPLAIKVLGSSVHGKNVKVWSSAVGRLQNYPQKKIMDVLKVSFDGLEETEKKIFLDIACFFKGGYIDHVINVLQGSYSYSPDIDIEVLIDRSLVTRFGRKVGMHDLLQELGRDIVRQECLEEPGRRSRLWLPIEIIHVLGQGKATSAVQSIDLQCPMGDDIVHLIDSAFSDMDRLRLLKICNVKVSGNITYLSNELQYLEWHECPLDSFPSDFQPDKLVELHIRFSLIKQLWKGKQGWRMLRLIDLSGSQYLMSTPDFTEVPNLEKLVLGDCTSLVEVHLSLGKLKKLIYVDMSNCKSIESIPPFSTSESLQILRLSLCSGLKRFPVFEGNMKSLLELHLDGTSIEEFPPSVEGLTGLIMLNLTDCKSLLRLPNTIGCLTSLKELHLTGCSNIDEIPENLNGMKYLEKLFIGGTSRRELSFTAGMKNLQYLSCKGCERLVPVSCKSLASFSGLTELDLSYCNLMDGAFLDDLSSLLSLTVFDLSGNCFVLLPESISQLAKLEILKLSNCRQLQLLPKKLPLSLRSVFADNCTSLTDYPDQIKVLVSPESGVTIVNSLISTDSSALATIAREWRNNLQGFVELSSIHTYTDGKQFGHYMPLSITIVDIRKQKEVCLCHKSNLTSFMVVAEDEIPEWYDDHISTRNPISIEIPPNLADDNMWKGFAACAIFSVKGHTALSVVEPDPDFCSYSYEVTLETDVMSTQPYDTEVRRHFGSSSHLVMAFYIPRLDVPQCVLNEASVVRAIFETTNPSMVVKKCAIRLVYDEDAGQFQRTSFNIRPGGKTVLLNGNNECDWLTESGKRERFITPALEEEPTLVWRKNLESVLPRYLEARKSSKFTSFKFNLRGSPYWFLQSFSALEGRGSLIRHTIKLPENLHKSKKWMGFAIFASLVEEVAQTMREDNYRAYVILATMDGLFTEYFPIKLEHIRPLSEEHHQLSVIYIPRVQIPEVLLTRTSANAIDLYISTRDSPHVKVHRVGYCIVYQEDIQGFADTIIRCMQREDAHLERMTTQDTRIQREKYSDSESQKYRNWDWTSDPNSFLCTFERAEFSKWISFMPSINQGNYAETPLPLNLFDDENWLGFAVCSWLSHDQYPSIVLSTNPENVTLRIHLHSDVDWSGLFDYSLWTANVQSDLTWFYYIPRCRLNKIWRQCRSARLTMSLNNHPSLEVHSCALRLVFKEDIELLVQTLTLAELP